MHKKADTTSNEKYLYDGYYVVDPQKKFKPKLFPQIMRFDSGDVYNRKDHNLTLSRLINLGVFKFVKNRFELSTNSQGDTGRLNSYYYLTPLPKKSLRSEISANTKSNNYVGSLVTLTFRNRNTFKGAEQLDIHANVGSEVQYSGYQSGYNTYRLGGGVTFAIPKFVVPFFKFNTTNAFVPKTKIDLSYEQNSLTIGFAGLSYLNTGKLVYHYILEGIDKEWKKADELNQALYNYLPPGTYTFKVKAENPDGLSSSNTTRLTIRVNPPFWKSWWFYAVLALCVAILLYGFDRERMRKKEAIQKMRSDIAGNLHQEINSALNNINILSEMAKLKAEKDPGC